MEDLYRIPELVINPLGERIIQTFFLESDQINFRQFMKTLGLFRPYKKHYGPEAINTREKKLKCESQIMYFFLHIFMFNSYNDDDNIYLNICSRHLHNNFNYMLQTKSTYMKLMKIKVEVWTWEINCRQYKAYKDVSYYHPRVSDPPSIMYKNPLMVLNWMKKWREAQYWLQRVFSYSQGTL